MKSRLATFQDVWTTRVLYLGWGAADGLLVGKFHFLCAFVYTGEVTQLRFLFHRTGPEEGESTLIPKNYSFIYMTPPYAMVLASRI